MNTFKGLGQTPAQFATRRSQFAAQASARGYGARRFRIQGQGIKAQGPIRRLFRSPYAAFRKLQWDATTVRMAKQLGRQRWAARAQARVEAAQQRARERVTRRPPPVLLQSKDTITPVAVPGVPETYVEPLTVPIPRPIIQLPVDTGPVMSARSLPVTDPEVLQRTTELLAPAQLERQLNIMKRLGIR